MDFNPFILISLSNFGEVTNRGAITTPSTTNHIIILSHLCLAINVPSLYNRFANIIPPFIVKIALLDNVR